MVQDPFKETLAPAGAIAEGGPELMPAAVDEEVADVVARFARALGVAGQGDGSMRHGDLVGVRPPGDGLDRPAVSVVGREVLVGVDPSGVLAEDRLDVA